MVSGVTIVATSARIRRPRRAETSEPSSFVVGKPQALTAQLRLQDAVLFARVLDDVVLFPLKPAEE
jgi:hypothetical protein